MPSISPSAPWRSPRYPTTLGCSALLYPDEIAYLHWVGEQAAGRGDGKAGAMIDLGSFLGGSSLALAQGSRLSGAVGLPEHLPTIHAYDLFRVTQTQHDQGTVPGRVGDSYLDQYKANLHEHLDRITTHEGFVPVWADGHDALRAVNTVGDRLGDPVSVLFIDCAKQWGVHHSILRAFGPSLRPGSIVIQQDLRGLMVYLALHMYQLRHVLSPTHFPDGGTVGFVASGAIDEASLDGLWTPEDVDARGRIETLHELAAWFDGACDECLSPWIWMAGAGEQAWGLDPALIAECIDRASAWLDQLRAVPMLPARLNPMRSNWGGEVARLARVLRGAKLTELADRVAVELAWASDEPPKSEPTHDLTAIWQRIEQGLHRSRASTHRVVWQRTPQRQAARGRLAERSRARSRRPDRRRAGQGGLFDCRGAHSHT